MERIMWLGGGRETGDRQRLAVWAAHVLAAHCLVCAVAWSGRALSRDDSGNRAARVKENLIYHVARLVRWPTNAHASADSALGIGVTSDGRGEAAGDVGADAAATMVRLLRARAALLELEPIRKPQGRSIVIHTLVPSDLVPGRMGKHLHVLYVASDSPQLARLRRLMASKPIVTIGEGQAFVATGGTFSFTTKQGRVRLLANRTAAERAGLSLGAQLLQHTQRAGRIAEHP